MTLRKILTTAIPDPRFPIIDGQWASQIQEINLFYLKHFAILIEWPKVKLPSYNPNFPQLEYVDKRISYARYVKVFERNFGPNLLYENNHTRNPEGIIDSLSCDRTGLSYCFAWSGSMRPDESHFGMTYFHLLSDEKRCYMTPKEMIVAVLRNAIKIDMGTVPFKGFINLFAKDHEGNALIACTMSGGVLRIGPGNASVCGVTSGPIEILTDL